MHDTLQKKYCDIKNEQPYLTTTQQEDHLFKNLHIKNENKIFKKFQTYICTFNKQK